MGHNESSQKDHDRSLQNERDIMHHGEQISALVEVTGSLNDDVVRLKDRSDGSRANWAIIISILTAVGVVILEVILKK